MESEVAVKHALQKVVHFPINTKKGEGVELSKKYKVGAWFPLFVLADSDGEVISRWTGYTGAGRFVRSLNAALRDLRTVKQRIALFESNRTFPGALELAKYHSETGEYMQGVKYYRLAERLAQGKVDYSYQVFDNFVQASWKDLIPFDDVLPSADSIISSSSKSKENVVKVALMMSKLSRKRSTTGRIAKYLRAGIEATNMSRIAKELEYNHVFQADLLLYDSHDTAGAIQLRKSSYGGKIDTDPATFSAFAKWCLDRRINLAEARQYAQVCADRAQPGPFKAQNLNTLAEICFQGGDKVAAISYIELAMAQDPDNDAYAKQWDRFQEEDQPGN